METRVSIRDIAKIHVKQQLERKKAILLNLELDACARQGVEWKPTEGILSMEDRSRYEMDQKVTLPNGTFTKQFSLPNYFRGENAYAARGCHVQKRELPMEHIPGVAPVYCGEPDEWMAFTSNFDIALFYACCTWDEDDQEWRPLMEKEIHAPIGEDGADYRYGVIYMADAADHGFCGAYCETPEYHVMTPAGSLVPGKNSQYIFAMRMRDSEGLQTDQRFERLVFEHTEKFCRDVYELITGEPYVQKNLRK